MILEIAAWKGRNMKIHVGWFALVVVGIILIYYYNPGGITCSVSTTLDSTLGKL